jgi:hypothetical protein
MELLLGLPPMGRYDVVSMTTHAISFLEYKNRENNTLADKHHWQPHTKLFLTHIALLFPNTLHRNTVDICNKKQKIENLSNQRNRRVKIELIHAAMCASAQILGVYPSNPA